jgi:inorganic pyrophosphatase
MNSLTHLPARDPDTGLVHVLIDTPKGSRNKFNTEKGKTVRNDRLVGVVETPYNRPAERSLDDLGTSRLDEIEHFFVSYNEAEGREFKPLGRHRREPAETLVEEGMRRWEEGREDRGEKQPARRAWAKKK